MREKRAGELTASVVANAVCAVLFNTSPLWRQYTQGVVLDDFIRVLWAVNLSLLVQMAGSMAMIFYRPPRFAAVAQVLGTAAAVLSMIVFYVVFPLDFSLVGAAWVNSLIRVVLIAGMAGGGIGLLVQLGQLTVRWRTFSYTDRYQKNGVGPPRTGAVSMSDQRRYFAARYPCAFSSSAVSTAPPAAPRSVL